MPPNRAASGTPRGGSTGEEYPGEEPSSEESSSEGASSEGTSSEKTSSEESTSGGQASGHRSSGNRSSGQRSTYDAVTAYFTCEEEPFRAQHVRALRKSHFPVSGEEAVQVIQGPWAPVPDRGLGDAGQVLEARAEGLFETHLILIRPEMVDYLLLEHGGERWEASLEEVLG